MEGKHQFSLRENVRLRLLKDMLSGLKINFPDVPNFILVVDMVTTRIVSSCAKMIELLEEGVVALERLDVKRKRFPSMHAIYFITPTESSVDCLMKDFANPKEPVYGNIHLFFSNHVDQPLLQKMGQYRPLAERIATFKEINIDFLTCDSNTFHFDMPDALPTIFSRPDLTSSKIMEEKIAYKLSTIIPTLFDYEKFHIIYNKNSTNPVAERVAKTLKDRIQRFIDLKKKQDEDSKDDKPAPIKIVILDRSFDPLTPVLHDYYYQSMITELLETKGDLVEYEDDDDKNPGKTVKKQAFLTEEDDLWVKYKYQFIGQAMSNISREFEEFVAHNKSSDMSRMDMSQLDLQQMSTIIKKMPQYQALMSKYTLHMTLIEKCISAFTEKGLKELGELEQTLATGIDAQGNAASNSRLIAAIASKVGADESQVDNITQLRLMIMACIALELQDGDKRTLVKKLNNEDDKLVLSKLLWLGVDPAKFASKKGKNNKKVDDSLAKSRLKGVSTSLCRYTPALDGVANNLLGAAKIDGDAYGSLFIPNTYDGSLGQRGAAIRRAGNRADGGDEKSQPKVIFFIIGGMSYAEIRVIAEFSNNNPQFNVISGSTYIMKPAEYIAGISKMLTKQEYEEAKKKDGYP